MIEVLESNTYPLNNSKGKSANKTIHWYKYRSLCLFIFRQFKNIYKKTKQKKLKF